MPRTSSESLQKRIVVQLLKHGHSILVENVDYVRADIYNVHNKRLALLLYYYLLAFQLSSS